MNINDLKTAIDRPNTRDADETTIQIAVHRPGSVGGQPTVAVTRADFGFDWDAGKLILTPEKPLLALTQEQADEITADARKASTFAGYNQYKKQADEIGRLKTALADMTAERDRLLKQVEPFLAIDQPDAVLKVTGVVRRRSPEEAGQPNGDWELYLRAQSLGTRTPGVFVAPEVFVECRHIEPTTTPVLNVISLESRQDAEEHSTEQIAALKDALDWIQVQCINSSVSPGHYLISKVELDAAMKSLEGVAVDPERRRNQIWNEALEAAIMQTTGNAAARIRALKKG